MSLTGVTKFVIASQMDDGKRISILMTNRKSHFGFKKAINNNASGLVVVHFILDTFEDNLA